MMKLPIYMDYQATTPVDDRVLSEMLPYFSSKFGNASSKQHSYGIDADIAVRRARTRIAELLGVDVDTIVFTSGSTESNNFAIKGIAESYRQKGRHIITCTTEHSSVLDPCKHLELQGFKISFLPADKVGAIDLDELKHLMTDDTILVSLMSANNEIGTIHPIEAIGNLCRSRNIVFHSDATQAIGKVPLRLNSLPIDLLSLSAHKMYGPKGIGALYIRSGAPHIRLVAQVDGGGHQRGLRSGTLNVPGIVGLGAAASILIDSGAAESTKLHELSQEFLARIRTSIQGATLNGPEKHRLPGNINLRFEGVLSSLLLHEMKNVAISTGSACSAETSKSSHVLRAIGLSDKDVASSIRISIGRFTTMEEIQYVCNELANAVNRIRDFSTF